MRVKPPVFAGRGWRQSCEVFNQHRDWRAGPWMTKAGVPFLPGAPCFKTGGAAFPDHIVPGGFRLGDQQVPDRLIASQPRQTFQQEKCHINPAGHPPVHQPVTDCLFFSCRNQPEKGGQAVCMQAAVAALFPVDIPAELFPEKGAVERIFQPLPFSVNGKSQFTLNLFHHPHTADIKGVDHIVTPGANRLGQREIISVPLTLRPVDQVPFIGHSVQQPVRTRVLCKMADDRLTCRQHLPQKRPIAGKLIIPPYRQRKLQRIVGDLLHP